MDDSRLIKKVLKQAGVVHTILNHSRSTKIVTFWYTSLLTFFANNYIIDWLINPRIPHHKAAVIVACTLIISESEVSITVLCLLCSPLLYSSTNQELFKKHVCNHSSHYGKYDGAVRPSYRLKLKYPLPFSVSYVWHVTQQYESRNVRKVPL